MESWLLLILVSLVYAIFSIIKFSGSLDNRRSITFSLSFAALVSAALVIFTIIGEYDPLDRFRNRTDLPSDPSSETSVQRIFFGTDRKVEAEGDVGAVFGHRRADKLTLGYADITIPSSAHRIGEIETPRSITVFSVQLWREAEDPEQHFTIFDVVRVNHDEFRGMVTRAVAEGESYPGTAFVFVHGFNTTFRSALFRTAQLAWDLRFDGPAFLYSWPSVGDSLDYATDLDSADNAALYIDEFLEVALSVPGIDRLHILAHSMGNAALAELLTRAGTRLSQRQDVPIDQLVLAAPDLDAGRFKDISSYFTKVANDVTMYASGTDLALLASKSIRSNYPRLGDVGPDGPVVVSGVETIDVSAVGTELLSMNHNMYARNRGLLNDLGALFKTAQHPPNTRMPTLEEVQGPSGIYWRMPE
jgi:esterase/lipase superfamily enzyme